MLTSADINPFGLVCYKAPGQPARTYGRSLRKRFVEVKTDTGELRLVKSYRVIEQR